MWEAVDPGAVAPGSGEAFEDFYLAEYGSIVGVAYALCGSRATAEDLAQEAFLAAHRNWSRIASYDAPSAWVRRVVVNLSTSALRRRVVEARALLRLTPQDASTVPEMSHAASETWAAVRRLPRRQAQVVVLFYFDDRPVGEIAQVLEMAPGTVKKHLHDARQALATALELDQEDV